MHLLKGLAFAYGPKRNDVNTEWMEDRNPPVRQVGRKLSKTFWFFREVLHYGNDAILAPETVQMKLKRKLYVIPMV